MVQETSTEGDPQSNGAAESSVNVVKGYVRSIKLAVGSASGVEVPTDHDLSPACTTVFSVGRDGKTAHEGSVGWRAVYLWHSSVSECSGCCSHPTVVWVLWIQPLASPEGGSSSSGSALPPPSAPPPLEPPLLETRCLEHETEMTDAAVEQQGEPQRRREPQAADSSSSSSSSSGSSTDTDSESCYRIRNNCC